MDLEDILKKMLEVYHDNDGLFYRDLDAEEDYDYGFEDPIILPGEKGRYEIITDILNKRFYCYVDAVSMDEALGNFFRHHPYLSYNMITEHLEV